jgi:NhaP-type Na+/H+ or K+/H+ antiporter
MVSYSTITVMTLMLASIAGVSMLGKSCDHYNISPPMVYILFGILTEVILHSAGLSFVNDSDSRIIVLLIAELTLVIVLFHDASTVNIKELQLTLPLRLLVIGLPITLTVMYFISRALFPDIGFSGALLIAAALTPTDAGLGAPTILNPKVPSRVRQALNVESGINDGLITPVVLIAIAGLEEHADEGAPNIPKVALIPISIALALAVVIGPFYAWLLDRSVKDDLSTQGGRELSLVMIPLLLYSLSVMTGANAFITAFLAGGIFGYFSDAHHKNHDLSEMLESVTDFLSGAAWFLAGEILVATFYDTGFHWQWAAIAFLALVPCRMIPVYFSLLGTDLDTYSKGFIGWFGPRGLATVIFALLAEEDFELSKGNVSEERMELLNEILGALLFTVTISVFAHGVSAAPLAEK